MHRTNSGENKKAGSHIFLMNALIGCSLGVALSGFILSISTRTRLHDFIIANDLHLNVMQKKLLGMIATGVHPLKNASLSFLTDAQIRYLPEIFFNSLSIVMIVNVILLLVTLNLSLKLQIEKNKNE